jgi:hypothetical protein
MQFCNEKEGKCIIKKKNLAMEKRLKNFVNVEFVFNFATFYIV